MHPNYDFSKNEHSHFFAPQVKRRALTPTLSAARDASTPLRRHPFLPKEWYETPRVCRHPDC